MAEIVWCEAKFVEALNTLLIDLAERYISAYCGLIRGGIKLSYEFSCKRSKNLTFQL